MPTLVLVESPTKAKALRKYLGSEYVVRASMGHVRDLPPKQLGVDVEAGFKPSYRLLPKARKTLASLRQALAGCQTLVLATDPDREGEAIAWHVLQACRAELKGKRVLRARFHEITPEAVRQAIAHPTELDQHLVDAQQARRVLDRLVGYQVSPVLWKGIAGPSGLSAGRVQSVALRLVVERDREIESFLPQEYWTLEAELSRTDASGPAAARFRARLYRVAGKKPELKSSAEAHAAAQALSGAGWAVQEVSQDRRTRKPFPPYITSTLQRDGSVRLRWPARKVMEVAQQLYEGVTMPGEGQVGLITYMRTDSTHVAPEAQAAAREVIERFYGAAALPERPPVYPGKVKNAQEAHEAIRPTRPARLPAEVRAALSPDQDALYTLIWRRFIASQMKPALYNVTTVTVCTTREGAPLPYTFRAVGRQLLDPGFLQVYDLQEESADDEAAENESLPPLQKGDPLTCHRLLPEQHFTRPPPHFTDAALIQELERLGIGRPSTFAAIVDTLFQRNYVTRAERSLRATELGRAVCDFLLQHFAGLFDVGFTARMEDQLDNIASGEAAWTAVMAEMWGPLSAQVAQAQAAAAAAPKVQVAAQGTAAGRGGAARRGGRAGRGAGRREKSKGSRPPGGEAAGPGSPAPAAGQTCPECGRPLVRRTGKCGPFTGCSGYPACSYILRTKPDRRSS